MSKRNWAEERDNTERTIFEKGRWTLTEDGEKTKSLYFDGDCVESVLMFNNYVVLAGGFVLFALDQNKNEYIIFSQEKRKPISKIEGKNITFKVNDDLLTFHDGDKEISFETSTMSQVYANNLDQLSIEF